MRAALEKYQDPYVAVRDGHLSTVGCVHYPKPGGAGQIAFPTGGMGIHFLNPELIAPVPDPMRPAILLYEPNGDKLRLVGAEWFIPLSTGVKERPTFYAKPSTKQTYQIYVGDKFDKSTIKRSRGNLVKAPIEFGAGGFFAEWLTVGEVTGKVLTVTVDFSAYKDELNPANSDNGLCGPETFCKWEKKGVQGICVSNLADNDAMLAANKSLKNEVDAACRNWAVKDLDCDPAGCFGFSFTLDKDFKPDGLGQAARPMPTKFPPWTTQFVRTTTAPDNKSQLKDGIESECYYPKLPPDCTAGAR